MNRDIPTLASGWEHFIAAAVTASPKLSCLRINTCGARRPHAPMADQPDILTYPPPLIARENTGAISAADIVLSARENCPYLEGLYNLENVRACPFMAQNGMHGLKQHEALIARVHAARAAAAAAAATARVCEEAVVAAEAARADSAKAIADVVAEYVETADEKE